MSLRDALNNVQALLKEVGAPAAAPPAPAAAPAANPADVTLKTIAAVTEKLGQLAAAIQQGNGAMPANLAAEVKTCVAALGTLAGAAPAAPPAPGAPAAAPPGAPAVGKNDVAKAELDAYTALNVTLNSVRDRMWCVQDLMREKKLAEAKGEIQAVSAMMANASSLADEIAAPAADPAAAVDPSAGTAAAPTKSAGNVSLLMTEMGLTKYVSDQLAIAAEEPEAQAVPRLKHLEGVASLAKDAFAQLAKDGFEQTGKEPITIKIEMETFYAPMAGPGMKKATGITATEEQSVKELRLGSVPETSNFDGSKVAKKFTTVHDALKLALAEGSSFGSDTKVEKAEGEDEELPGYVWPNDLNAPLMTEAEIKKNAPSFEKPALPFGSDFQG